MNAQKVADETQEHIAAAIRGMTRLQKHACDCAADGAPGAKDATGAFGLALGALWQAHGYSCSAAVSQPDISPKFGGK